MREEFTRVARAQGWRRSRRRRRLNALKRRLDPRAYNGASMVGLDRAWSSRATAAPIAWRSRTPCAWRSSRRGTAFRRRSVRWSRACAARAAAARLQRAASAAALPDRARQRTSLPGLRRGAGAIRLTVSPRRLRSSCAEARGPRARPYPAAGDCRNAAEILIGCELVAQLAEHELDHHRIVEQADPGDLVGDDVLRIAEIGERGEHGTALVVVERPVRVGQHVEQRLQLHQPSRSRSRARRSCACAASASAAAARISSSSAMLTDWRVRCSSRLKVTQVSIREFDGQFVWHVSPVCERLLAGRVSRSTLGAFGCAGDSYNVAHRRISRGVGDDRKSACDDRVIRARRTRGRCSASTQARAEQFLLPTNGDTVIGSRHNRHCTLTRTRCSTSGARYGVGYEEIIAANPGIDPWLPG